MSNAAKKRLLDAAVACAAIAEFTTGRDFAGYEADRMLSSAVERQFEILGEALGKAARADAFLEITFPDLRKIVALRNRLIHGYDAVDHEIMWDLVTVKLPPFADALRTWLSAHGDV